MLVTREPVLTSQYGLGAELFAKGLNATPLLIDFSEEVDAGYDGRDRYQQFYADVHAAQHLPFNLARAAFYFHKMDNQTK